jgi:hypothetical protein
MTQHLGPLGGNNDGSGRPAGFPGFRRQRSDTTAYAQKEDVARTPNRSIQGAFQLQISHSLPLKTLGC